MNEQITLLRGKELPRGAMSNQRSLPDVLAEVLTGKTMDVVEAASAAKAAGYRSGSRNFRTMVNQALIRNPRFRKVGRGRYTVKKNQT